MKKLGVSDVAALVNFAVQRGITNLAWPSGCMAGVPGY
jgi:hypothetical protein